MESIIITITYLAIFLGASVWIPGLGPHAIQTAAGGLPAWLTMLQKHPGSGSPNFFVLLDCYGAGFQQACLPVNLYRPSLAQSDGRFLALSDGSPLSTEFHASQVFGIKGYHLQKAVTEVLMSLG